MVPTAKGKGILTPTTQQGTLSNVHGGDAASGAGKNGGNSGKPAPAVSAPNTVQLHQLVTGCKVMVERPDEEPRRAEILSIRAGRQARSGRARPGGESAKPATEYYVHYVEFNKVGVIYGCAFVCCLYRAECSAWMNGSRAHGSS